MPAAHSTRPVETNTASDTMLNSATHTTFSALVRTKSYLPPRSQRDDEDEADSRLREPAVAPGAEYHEKSEGALPSAVGPGSLRRRHDVREYQHPQRDGNHRAQ